VFQSELAGIAGSANVSAELSSVESGDTLSNALAVIGDDRVLLGTHAPIYYPAAGVAKVEESGREDNTLNRVVVRNAAAFFKGIGRS
jgi:predicted TIM-barrel fold metal-dependent hydrolase